MCCAFLDLSHHLPPVFGGEEYPQAPGTCGHTSLLPTLGRAQPVRSRTRTHTHPTHTLPKDPIPAASGEFTCLVAGWLGLTTPALPPPSLPYSLPHLGGDMQWHVCI